MRIRNLVIIWLIFCVICIISHFSLQTLHSINIWDYIGVSQSQIDPFVLYTLSIIEVGFILGSSSITGLLLWKVVFLFSFEGGSVGKFSLEILQSWVALSGFECSLILYIEISSVLIRSTLLPVYLDLQIIFNIGWINLILVSLFYSFIGFQALRKRLGLTNFFLRVPFGTGQVVVTTVIGALILVPFGLLDFIFNQLTYPISTLIGLIVSTLIYLYYVISIIGLLEVAWSIGRRIEKEKELTQQEINANIFFLQILTVLLPLFLVPNLFPFPLFLLMANTGMWIVFSFSSVVLSFFAALFYHFLNKLVPELFDNVESGMENLKYQFEKVLAVRGTIFNYPQPVDILSGGEKAKIISGQWQKVTLKMACGHCYHVFKTQAFKDGSKVKPVPCPFCGSMGTTPVWE